MGVPFFLSMWPAIKWPRGAYVIDAAGCDAFGSGQKCVGRRPQVQDETVCEQVEFLSDIVRLSAVDLDRFLKGDKKVLRFQAKLRNVTNNDKTRDFVINYCESPLKHAKQRQIRIGAMLR